MENSTIQVFLADEDDGLRLKIAAGLRRRGYEVFAFNDGMALFSHLRERLARPGARASVVVAQGRLPVLSALQILHSLRGLDIELPFVLMTRLHEQSVRDVAERAGASAVLLKPFLIEELVKLVDDFAHGQEGSVAPAIGSSVAGRSRSAQR